MTTRLKFATATLALVASTTFCAFAQSTPSAARANFIEADVNSDRALTIDEFTRFIDLNAEARIGNARLIQRTGQYMRAFDRVDANKDGLTTPKELSAFAGE